MILNPYYAIYCFVLKKKRTKIVFVSQRSRKSASECHIFGKLPLGLQPVGLLPISSNSTTKI